MLLPSVPVDIRGQTLNDATMFAKADKLLVSGYAYINYSDTHNCPSLSLSLSPFLVFSPGSRLRLSLSAVKSRPRVKGDREEPSIVHMGGEE